MNKSSSTASILIVDDSEDSADITAAYLEDGGFEKLSFARSAQEAFDLMGIGVDTDGEASTTDPFDLVIMDIMMPGIDGIEACARIRLHPPSRHLPILMLSAAREIQALNQAFMAGANDFVGKPVGQMDLIARVRTLLRFRREQQRRQYREAELERLTHDLQSEMLDKTAIDPVTHLWNAAMVEVKLGHIRKNRDTAALALARIDDFNAYTDRYGVQAGNDMAREVARILETVPAPIGTMLAYYGEGSFMMVQPSAPDDLGLAETCSAMSAAVAAQKIPHGSSARSDFVTLSTLSSWDQGDELDRMSAKLVAGPRDRQANGDGHVWID